MAEKAVFRGYGKRLDVDLTTEQIRLSEVAPEFAAAYLGGVGFSTKILYDEVGTEVDPFDPANVVILANGALTGSGAVCASRTEITTKHPLTGHLGTGNTGGLWGVTLKRAGFDLIVVRGAAARPAYLFVDDGKVELRDAGHLWGKDTDATTKILEQELAPGSPSLVKVLAIGPAGEHLVRFACPMNDYHHCAARSGAGAVMGAKKLKGIAVRGSGLVKPERPGAFQAAAKEARECGRQYEESAYACWGADRPTKGSADRVGYFPAKNYQTGVIPGWDGTRDAPTALQYVTGIASPCHACPSPCFRLGEVKEGKYAGVSITRATHQGVTYAWGAKCAIDNLPAIWKCKQLCNELGMDYDSAAGVIAFALELYQRGIITEGDSDGLALTWGNEDAIISLLERIAHRQGFGAILAEGSVRAAAAIGRGAEKYVIAIKGLEMMDGIDPRSGVLGAKAWSLGGLTNPRGGDNIKGTHFFAERYEPRWWVDKFDMPEDVKQKVYGLDLPPQRLGSTWQGKPLLVKWFEDMYSLANALGFCFFPVGMAMVLGPTRFSKLYSAFVGRDVSPEEIAALGGKLFNIMKAFTARQGLTRKDDCWAERFYTEPVPDGPRKGAIVSRDEVDRVLDEYYALRGWDVATGLPTEATLAALGLGDIADDLHR